MRRTVGPLAGSSLSSLAGRPSMQVAVVATGLVALVGGVGLQVVWLLLIAAAVASGLAGTPADESPGSGGHGGGGGGGGLDRPLDPTSVPPAGLGTR